MLSPQPPPAPVIALAPPVTHPEVVEVLQELLGRAKDGEILGIAIAAHTRGGCTASTYKLPAGADVAHLVCAIERVKLRLLAHGE